MAGMTIGFKSRGSSSSTGGRIGLTIFLLIFALAGAGFGFLVVRSALRDEATRSWTTMPCRIESSTYELPKGDRDGYRFQVRYRYSFNSQEYTSSQFQLEDQEHQNFESIQRSMLRYVSGVETVCHINPAAPSEAILEHASRWKWATIFLPLIFLGIGVGGIWAVWRHRPRESQSLAASVTKKSSGTWIAVLIGVVFFSAGAAFNGFFFAPTFMRMLSARSWPEVDATVVNSRVRVSRGEDSDTYAVDVLYRYRFEEREYLSNQYNLFGGSSSGRAAKQQVVSRMRRGTQTKVFVNPDDPVIAVIDRAMGWWMLLALIPTVFMLVGGGILVGSLLGKKKETASPIRPLSSRLAQASSGDSQPLSYSSGSSRRTKALAIGIFALFWNGVSWTIAVVMWTQKAGTVPLLFISIFLLIGLGAVAGFFHSLLGVFNPALQLVLSHAPLRVGDRVTAKWNFTGRFDRIGRLTIVIQGREEATYRRGTTTTTDKEIFRTLDLVDTAKRIDIARGQVDFIIPADTMHSFEASNNKIVWEMVVKGEITNWPDVKEEIKLSIQAPKPEARHE